MRRQFKKEKNRGYSLLELIVVVLILGIIATALAPQVMRWVGTARTNVDDTTAKEIKTAVQIALTEFQKEHCLAAPDSGDTYSFRVVESGSPAKIITGIPDFDDYLNGVMNEAPRPEMEGKVFRVSVHYETYAVTVDQVDE